MDSLIARRYQIINTLGKGGFGETFLARDTHLPSQKLIVIKRLRQVNINHRISPDILADLFQKEAQVLEELGENCSQIPSLYAYFVENEQFYLVQEYIDGTNLADLGVINSSQCRSILISLLQTLQFIHSKKIIHRDIKPENIIIRHSDGLPILIDFGAVKETMATVALSSGSMVSSVVVGTRGFMPPEQSTGRTVYSSDLYALALTMIYSLTGKYPIEFPSNSLNGQLEWSSFVSDIDPQLQEVLSKASKIDLSQRYPTAKEMLQDLCMSEMQTVAVIPQKREIPTKLPVNSHHSSNSEINPPTIPIPVKPPHSYQKPLSPQPITSPKTKPIVTPNYSEENIPSPPVKPCQNPSQPSYTYSQNPPKNNHLWIFIIIGAIAIGGLITSGFLQYIRKTEAQLAQIEQEKAETEARLAEEQKKREEEAKRREEAEKERQKAELERIRAEELRRQAESQNNNNDVTNTDVTNNEEIVNPEVEDSNITESVENNTNSDSEVVNSLDVNSAINTLVEFYTLVSQKNFDLARDFFANPDNLDPSFFEQFSQVTVGELRVTNQQNNVMTLEGKNTYFYQDGTKQKEKRDFTLEIIDGKIKISNSNFLEVIEQRK